ncbi:hypothetical protein GCM10007301_37600 [Azorhizobium oxalatiphilum]|uniref:Uncharacterized protein n=1 Tax=Azorhizobium oxalatiphilum TaxID=980631 RepID=A0A917C6E6_9HYPH|nr:hypothetical protein [Azorhizobium oxalatiphilum]GGF74267.1 hypothetical protein GCM10007301_37600 [Azorhizobium oxalatiphilum]
MSGWDWFPYIFFPFKIIVLGVGMFFAVKWHYDQGKKQKSEAGGPQAPAERTVDASK